jgi:UDP-N-acetylglucosamine acyltransferase
MPTIHPTAVVDSRAELADDASVGPLCYVGPGVKVGAGTRLISHVAVFGPTTLGADNEVWPHAVLGADPQDLKFHGEETVLTVGDHNVIRECVTLHRGTANGGGVTRVGSHNLLMVGVHIAHDCVVGDQVIMANNVTLAGHVAVQDYANIGGCVAVHHFVTFGRHCFVGGTSRIVNDVPPFMKVEGSPSRVRGVNTIGLARQGYPAEAIERLKDAYRRLFRGQNGEDEGAPPVGHVAAALDHLEQAYAGDECIATLVQFMRNKMAGVYGRYREAARPDNRYQGAGKP